MGDDAPAREALVELAAEMPERVACAAGLKAEEETLDQVAALFLVESEEWSEALNFQPAANSSKEC